MKPLFKTGEKVYIVNINTGHDSDPVIERAYVTKVGKKYVTLDNGASYDFSYTDGNSAVYAGSGESCRRETVFRSEIDALELIEKHKLMHMLKKSKNPDITTEQLVAILAILGIDALPESPVLDESKRLIDGYCAREFGEDSKGDYSDLRHVPLAYTETEDGKHIQAEANLVNPSIRTYIEDELVESKHYRSLSELITSELKYLDFDALVRIDND